MAQLKEDEWPDRSEPTLPEKQEKGSGAEPRRPESIRPRQDAARPESDGTRRPKRTEPLKGK